MASAGEQDPPDSSNAMLAPGQDFVTVEHGEDAVDISATFESLLEIKVTASSNAVLLEPKLVAMPHEQRKGNGAEENRRSPECQQCSSGSRIGARTNKGLDEEEGEEQDEGHRTGARDDDRSEMGATKKVCQLMPWLLCSDNPAREGRLT